MRMESEAAPFSAADLRTRMARMGTGEDETTRYGDHLLNPDLVQLAEHAEARDAAVLVPVVDYGLGTEAGVILTTRAAHLRKHSGQIAFPGGSVDPGDGSPEAAALREAEEEVALERRFVEPIGRLPRYFTTTGFRITPVVAIVSPGYELRPSPSEVDDAFEVPLGFLMNAANHRQESRVWNDVLRHYYTMPFGDRFIWGVTAGIIRTLYERFYAS
ncbi:CoA pyrophosphatase [Antarcticirhabdus aurantiaca]|uniref:CoA pyrophosphatase n=1 Tax=Antarcticirhabdus aurantiaca TaxID=2606717 RepID=A0ACD4NTM1_9HYPH|nr:CoA pyrophosphatase [Antarcticirhabdus aurantiaca]WAJ30050.1 CoA pyrophosphatase [Jeongeuplla avenae]